VLSAKLSIWAGAGAAGSIKKPAKIAQNCAPSPQAGVGLLSAILMTF